MFPSDYMYLLASPELVLMKGMNITASTILLMVGCWLLLVLVSPHSASTGALLLHLALFSSLPYVIIIVISEPCFFIY